jgi:hypothetical protein
MGGGSGPNGPDDRERKRSAPSLPAPAATANTSGVIAHATVRGEECGPLGVCERWVVGSTRSSRTAERLVPIAAATAAPPRASRSVPGEREVAAGERVAPRSRMPATVAGPGRVGWRSGGRDTREEVVGAPPEPCEP